MTANRSDKWYQAMAELEGDTYVGAGRLSVPPLMSVDHAPASDEARLVLGRFVSLMRRRKGWTTEKLADATSVDVGDLLAIESDPAHVPEVYTLYQLAEAFEVSQEKLMDLSGLTVARERPYVEELVRYAARSASVDALNEQEAEALDSMISVLATRSS